MNSHKRENKIFIAVYSNVWYSSVYVLSNLYNIKNCVFYNQNKYINNSNIYFYDTNK